MYFAHDKGVQRYDAGGYHYNGRAATLFHAGRTVGMTMVDLLEDLEAVDAEAKI
jgi:hypothetical protein